jgi:hypothetical protein
MGQGIGMLGQPMCVHGAYARSLCRGVLHGAYVRAWHARLHDYGGSVLWRLSPVW